MGLEGNSGLASIVLPTYNGERFLSRSIQSCIDQTYQNIEIIIVIDGSTDNSLEIAKNFAESDPRICIISNEINKNLPASLNIGHKAANGTYLTWTSDDNYYHPQAIEKMVKELNTGRSELVFTNFWIIDENEVNCGSYRYVQGQSILFENIVRASFLYRKEVYDRNNGYDENLFKIEDYAFWLMIARNTKFSHIPEDLYFYRHHQNSLTAGKTIRQFVYEKEYVNTVKNMYQKFLVSYHLENDYLADLFTNLHLHQEIDVRYFLMHYKEILRELREVFNAFDLEQVQQEIDLRLRNNMNRFKSNQNFWNILVILKKRPQLLSYSKHKTLKILYKSLFPYISPTRNVFNPS